MATDLARSRALVRLDGPGHIMPIEPVTPPDSKAWRVVHFPVVLAVCALGLLAAAALGIKLLGLGLTQLVFVRVVERRRDVEELGMAGWASEAGLGVGIGLALSLSVFLVQLAGGAIDVEGFALSRHLLASVVTQVCTAICLELVLRGLLFRLGERLLGSWLALLGSAAFFGGGVWLSGMPGTVALAAALQSGLLFAAMYMVTRRLWAAIGLHAGVLIAQAELYGGNGLLTSRLAGPEWLTGGQGGADASLPGLVLTALLVAALVATAIRRGRIVRPIWRRGRSVPAVAPSFG
jgi:uncharacterized protein